MAGDSVGARIQALREKKRWSMRQLAAQLGVKHVSIYRWEHNKGSLSLTRIEQLAKVFEIAPSTLIRCRRKKETCTNGQKEKTVGSS
jgi:transcriptional regulator with XRE-family HTH domain